MTKPKNATNAKPARDEVSLTFTDISTPVLSMYEQQKAMLIKLLSASKWDNHLISLQINVRQALGLCPENKLELVCKLGGGGESSELGSSCFDVMTSLRAGRDIHEQGGLIVMAYDEMGEQAEICTWFKEPPKLDAKLLKEIFEHDVTVDCNESRLGDNWMHMITANKKSVDGKNRGEMILRLTTRSKRGALSSEILHVLDGGRPAEIVDIEPGIIVSGLRG